MTSFNNEITPFINIIDIVDIVSSYIQPLAFDNKVVKVFKNRLRNALKRMLFKNIDNTLMKTGKLKIKICILECGTCIIIITYNNSRIFVGDICYITNTGDIFSNTINPVIIGSVYDKSIRKVSKYLKNCLYIKHVKGILNSKVI